MPTSRKSRSKTSKSRRGFTKDRCRTLLSGKIRKNMREFKKKRWSSRGQAIAVSFSQTRKRYPQCGRYFKRSR